MKTFLLFRYSEWSEKHGANLVLPECCVLANSDKEAAVKTGGHLESRLIRNEATKVVVFPRCHRRHVLALLSSQFDTRKGSEEKSFLNEDFLLAPYFL